MNEEDVGEEKPASETLGDKKVSVEDLNDALIDDTEDSEGEGVTIRRRKEASDTDQEDFKECKAASSSCLSSSCADTTDASESSVTNSPNPRQTQKKGKKGKKKKRWSEEENCEEMSLINLFIDFLDSWWTYFIHSLIPDIHSIIKKPKKDLKHENDEQWARCKLLNNDIYYIIILKNVSSIKMKSS